MQLKPITNEGHRQAIFVIFRKKVAILTPFGSHFTRFWKNLKIQIAKIQKSFERFKLHKTYMNWIDKCSQADECAKIGNYKISRLLLFA